MPRNITPHDALIINEWWVAGFTRPTVHGTAHAVREAPRKLLSIVPGYREVADRLDASKYAEQQNRLRRLGGVAAVDVSLGAEPSSGRSRRTRVMSVLQESRIIEQDRIVAVQPIIYATAQREHQRSLTRRARALSKAIDARKPSGETLFNPQPIVVDSQRGEIGLYEAIDEAALDLRQKARELVGEGQDAPAPSLIITMAAGHIARALRGSTHDDVARSGVVVLHDVDRLPRNNVWLPLATVAAVAAPEALSELSPPLDIRPGHTTPQAVQPYTEVYA